MFKQANYDGNNIILKKMASFSISQDTLDIVQKIGPSKFIRLAKTGAIFDTFTQEYIDWLKTCPDSIREALCRIFDDGEFGMDNSTWFDLVCRIVSLSDLADFIDEEPLWCDSAPERIIYIIGKALDDPDVVEKNPLVTDVIINYLKEGFRVAIWAGLV